MLGVRGLNIALRQHVPWYQGKQRNKQNTLLIVYQPDLVEAVLKLQIPESPAIVTFAKF